MPEFYTKPYIFRIFLLFVLLKTSLLYAQNTVLEPAENNQTKIDTISLLLIPYNPMYYLSDSDRQIAETSNKSVFVIRDNFRSSLDQVIKKRFSENHVIYSVLTDTSEQAKEDLDRIYFEQILKYEKSPSFKKQNQYAKKIIKSPNDKGLAMDKSTMPTENSLIDDQFMNVSFKDKDILPELAARYENDYFLFLNQFEIRIDYNDCLDLAHKIYNRQLKVHYSVYDRNGNFITGDYVKVLFPSNTNNVNEIISRNFPVLAGQLAEAF